MKRSREICIYVLFTLVICVTAQGDIIDPFIEKPDEDFQAALLTANQELEANPKSPEAYFRRGYVNFYLGKYEQAVEDYTLSMKYGAKPSQVCSNRGYAYIMLNKFEKALSDLTHAIEQGDKRYSVYHRRGTVYQALGKQELALRDFNQALTIEPNDGRTLVSRGIVMSIMGRFQEAYADFSKVIESEKMQAIIDMARFNRALLSRKIGKIDQAIEEFGIVRRNKDYALKASFEMAEMYEDAGDFDQALKLLEGVIETKRDYIPAHVLRGIIYKRMHQSNMALLNFQQAASASAETTDDYFYLGMMMRNLERIEEAEKLLNIAARAQPHRSEIFVERAKLHQKAGDERKALEDVETALKLNSYCKDAYLCRSEISLETGKNEQALSDIEHALEIYPYDVKLLNQKGNILDVQRNCDEAINAYSQALERAPRDLIVMVLFNRSSAYANNKQAGEAMKDLEKILEYDPEFPPTYFNMAALCEKDDPQKAKKLYIKYLNTVRYEDTEMRRVAKRKVEALGKKGY